MIDLTTHHLADKLLAIWTSDRWFNNLGVEEKHVQMSSCVKSEAHAKEIHKCLDERPVFVLERDRC